MIFDQLFLVQQTRIMDSKLKFGLLKSKLCIDNWGHIPHHLISIFSHAWLPNSLYYVPIYQALKLSISMSQVSTLKLAPCLNL